MTTVHADGSRHRMITKGSPEALVATQRFAGDGDLRAAILGHASAFAIEGYRVLAVSEGASGTPEPAADRVRFLGLLAIADPPKPAAASTVARCRAAGITPVLITGDHPATARAIAEQVGIVEGTNSLVVTGDQIRDRQVPDLTAPRSSRAPLRNRSSTSSRPGETAGKSSP